MTNPWLAIPLGDYEGHMNAPGVDQLRALASLFAEALAVCRPRSVAVLGVAGGNGLDCLDPATVERIVGVDLHPHYLEAVRERYPDLPLTLVCADLAADTLDMAAVDLVHAALIFEHAGIGRCLQNAVSLVAARGHLAVVLQLPSAIQAGVAPTPFSSMQNLKEHFAFVDPATLAQELLARGLALEHEQRRSLPGGKVFWLGIFKRGH